MTYEFKELTDNSDTPVRDYQSGDRALVVSGTGVAMVDMDSAQVAMDARIEELRGWIAGRDSYTTLALATAAGETTASVEVTNDPTESNNGIWVWDDGSLIKSAFDPVAYAEALSDDINNRTAGLVTKSLPPESGYILAFQDPQTRRAALLMKTDGTLVPLKIDLPSASVGVSSLDTELSSMVSVSLLSESGYVLAFQDPQTRRAALLIRTDGTVEVPRLEVLGPSIDIPALAKPLNRQAVAQVADLVDSTPVNAWRSRVADIAVKTAPGDGSGWTPFPDRSVRRLQGKNRSGASFDIRKSSGLAFKGKSYSGEYSPGTVASMTHVGTFSGPSVSTPSGEFVAGDFYYYANGAGSVSTGTWAGMSVGDLLVFDGSTWAIQSAPGEFGSRDRHGFWRVSEAGTFNGVELAVDDLLLYVGRQTGGGGWQYERWSKIQSTDLCYWGEFAPAAGMPASPLAGAVWQASEAGTASGIDFTEGDYALCDGEEWCLISNEPAQVVAADEFVSLPCLSTAAEWEVRRTDKSASRSGIRLQAQTSLKIKRSTDALWLVSDSMFGVSGVGTKVLERSGRDGVVNSFGGSTSEQIVGMMEYEVAELGDRYAGHVLVAWHGQNNQPSTESAAAQIKEGTLRMLELAACRDQRAMFMTVLGQRASVWNGTRLVVSQHEDQMAGTGILNGLVQWYEAIMPGQYLNTYESLIAAATDAPDPQYPGMTEQEVAAAYGVVPFSFWNYYYTRNWDAADLNYLGTWSDTALPTSSASEFDYYLRIASGRHGNLIIYEDGEWAEREIDVTHLSPAGASALASAINQALENRNL